jgi:hypothetical protein
MSWEAQKQFDQRQKEEKAKMWIIRSSNPRPNGFGEQLSEGISVGDVPILRR